MIQYKFALDKHLENNGTLAPSFSLLMIYNDYFVLLYRSTEGI